MTRPERFIRGKKVDLIIIDECEERTLTPEEQWAYDEARKIVAYGDHLGEPVHPFVEDRIRMAILGARRRGRREGRSG